jgi:hypothetical protein
MQEHQQEKVKAKRLSAKWSTGNRQLATEKQEIEE